MAPQMIPSERPDSPPTRVLPDMQFCRAADLTSTFAECLVEKPATCPYAMSFGYSYLCRHPDRRAIIDNSKLIRTQ